MGVLPESIRVRHPSTDRTDVENCCLSYGGSGKVHGWIGLSEQGDCVKRIVIIVNVIFPYLNSGRLI